jgi:hypothetical protein
METLELLEYGNSWTSGVWKLSDFWNIETLRFLKYVNSEQLNIQSLNMNI